MVTGADAGGIAKIDVSALFLRHFLDSRVFFLEPLLHEGFVTFPCPMQRLPASDAELSQKPSHGRRAQRHMELILKSASPPSRASTAQTRTSVARVLPRHRAVNPLQRPAIEFRRTSRNWLGFQGAPATAPVLRQPSVHGGPPRTKNPGNRLGAFAVLHTPYRTFAHRFQRLVIKFPRVIFSHASMKSFATHQVKKNVLLFMNCSISIRSPNSPPRDEWRVAISSGSA